MMTRTKPSSRAGRQALAIVGLSIAIACSGNTTSPTPPPTPVPPVTPSSTVLLWPLAGRDGRDWVINNYVDPPIYHTTITLMDLVIAAGDMILQQIKDPAPNATSIPRGSVLGVGVSMAGGGAGDVIRLVITAPTGATFSDNPLTFTTGYRHSFWFWNRELAPTPGVWTVAIFVNGVLVRRETVIAPA